MQVLLDNFAHEQTYRLQHSSMRLWLSRWLLQRRIGRVADGQNRQVAGCYVINTRKFDGGLSRLLHDEVHWLDVTDRVQYKIQARRAGVPMSSWNSSAVHDEKLHTNSRRRQSSTPAVRQSAEDDRSAVSTGQ